MNFNPVQPSGEHEHEPVHGLPGQLPPGEHLLWQGSPRWTALAVQAFHLRKLALYFALLLAWRALEQVSEGAGAAQVLGRLAWPLLLAASGLGLVGLLAWLSASTTVYTLTDRRVVMRIGIVLTVTFNLPLARIVNAGLRAHGGGSGDISLQLAGADRIAYLHLWPHVRPWRLRRTEPMLRALPDADAVARTLAAALRATLQADEKATADAPDAPGAAGAAAAQGRADGLLPAAA